MPDHAYSRLLSGDAAAPRTPGPRHLHPVADRAARSSADDAATGRRSPWAPFHEIAQIVAEFTGKDDAVQEAFDRAYRRALTLSASATPQVLSERVARIGFAAEVVAAVAPPFANHPGRLGAMIDRLVTPGRISRCLLGRETLRAPALVQLPPDVMVDVALSLLLAFSGARAAAVWARGPADDLIVLASAGEVAAMPEESQRIAQQTVAGETVVARHDGALVAAEITRRAGTAALVVFGDDVLSPQRRLLLDAVEPLLILALEHQAPAGADSPAESCATVSRPGPSDHDALVAATKRLTRLRFDLHDGPQQDVLMLAEDLWQFRDRLQDALADHAARDRLLVGIDDLEARLIALDGDLRRLSASVESPFLQPAALPEALARIAEAFAARTGIEPTLEMSGDLTNLTDSQQITLLALIREALSNVREHADARHVSVTVAALDGGLTASVMDDGRGFEPETALIKAAHGGHLGLVSMHERVRMLGGRTEITSRPGGPTVISLTLSPSAADIG